MTEEVKERLTLLADPKSKEDLINTTNNTTTAPTTTSSNHAHSGECCDCYKERENVPDEPTTQSSSSGSIFRYIYQELTWGQVSWC